MPDKTTHQKFQIFVFSLSPLRPSLLRSASYVITYKTAALSKVVSLSSGLRQGHKLFFVPCRSLCALSSQMAAPSFTHQPLFFFFFFFLSLPLAPAVLLASCILLSFCDDCFTSSVSSHNFLPSRDLGLAGRQDGFKMQRQSFLPLRVSSFLPFSPFSSLSITPCARSPRCFMESRAQHA